MRFRIDPGEDLSMPTDRCGLELSTASTPARDASWRKIGREFGEIRTAVWVPNEAGGTVPGSDRRSPN
jgi:hypothetical protein